MALRFFVDHCVPSSVGALLTTAGHEVLQLRNHLPTEASDPVVLLTLNGDFADIVAYPPSKYGGLVALQTRNHPKIIAQVAGKLTAYLQANPHAAHFHGKLLTVEAHRIRIRS